MNRAQRRAAEHRSASAPSSPAAMYEQALALYSAGRLGESESLCRKAVATNPRYAVAHHLLGVIALQAGRHAEAESLLAWAITLDPRDAVCHSNHGNALRAMGRIDDAIAAYRRALALSANFVDAQCNLGRAWIDKGEIDSAVQCLSRAIVLEPRHFQAHHNLGVAHAALGELAAAKESYRKAIAIHPGFARSHDNLGGVLFEEGRIEEAEARHREATRLQPDLAEAHANLGTALYELGRVEDAQLATLRALMLKCGVDVPDPGTPGGVLDLLRNIPAIDVEAARVLSNLLMLTHYDARYAKGDLIEAARRYGASLAIAPMPARPAEDRPPARRLRVGYVSAHFCWHPVGYFLTSVLEARDPDGCEVFLYGHVAKIDHVTARLREAADHWRDISSLTDAAAAERIREDGVDILVDLAGHSANNRLPLFALRPAPVQASWLGYFGATGLPAIDYLLMDEYAIPPGEAEAYPEAIVRLPKGRLCYDPPDDAPTPAEPPSPTRGFVAYGSFNNLAKVNDAVVALWAEILRADPTSRLVLKWKTLAEPATRDRMTRAFAAHGVAPERLDLRGASPHREMLKQYADIDVALDPFPFGGGLTSCEALWMGVPVVTWPGDRPASRQTLGFLAAIELRDGVASSASDYVARAIALGGDVESRRRLRRGLRARVAASPLCDAPRFARALEASYAEMWRRWTEGRPAAGFDTPDAPFLRADHADDASPFVIAGLEPVIQARA